MYSIRCFKFLRRKMDAFSLIEAAIGLTIMGLLSILGLSAIKKWRQQQQIAITQDHQTQILTAIALYGIRTGSFPYPADPKAPLHAFGLSQTLEGDPKDQVGIVPYRTLGLSEAVARDGYGRYFTYVGGSMGGHSICSIEPTFPLSISQRLPDGSLNNITPIGDPISVILISHGANGYGAWEGEMGRTHQKLSGIHGPDEKDNGKAIQSFIVAPLSYASNFYYDDHIIWITRNHLLAIYADTICKPIGKPFL